MAEKSKNSSFGGGAVSELKKWGEVNIGIVLLALGISLITTLTFATLFFIHSSGEHVNDYDTFPFVSKRVFLEDPNDVIINFVPLRKALRAYVEPLGGAVGVYFEYLPSGVSIGVNATEEIRLASLSKVPLAMSILKKVEKKEINLTDKVFLKEEHLDQKFGDLWKRGAGASLTIEELIKLSLQQSDNTAYQTLFAMLSDKEVEEVYENLEIEISAASSSPLVSPKSYSSIFRSLYLASFLPEGGSNYLLDILTRTAFHDKIPAGVPKDVLIAHKIGVFDRADTAEKVYTDCGIVYIPLRPYILCIFVQDTESVAVKHMALISKMVYGYVNLVGGRE